MPQVHVGLTNALASPASTAHQPQELQQKQQEQGDAVMPTEVLPDLGIVEVTSEKVIPWEELHFDQLIDTGAVSLVRHAAMILWHR
jgi:hypothetical protein